MLLLEKEPFLQLTWDWIDAAFFTTLNQGAKRN